MEALEFIREAQRMCHSTKHCLNCTVRNACILDNCNASEDDVKTFVSFVEQWIKEHPVITNAQKLTEVFGDKAIYAISATNVQALKDWLNEPYEEKI